MSEQISPIIYKSLISTDLHEDIIVFYEAKRANLNYCSGSSNFPLRKQLRELPEDLIERLSAELTVTLSGYYTDLKIFGQSARIYESTHGVVKAHRDVSMHKSDTHTCIIYLSDNFLGGCAHS